MRVVLTIAEERGSHSYSAGVVLQGTQPDLVYLLATAQVNVTFGGLVADLAGLDGATVMAQVDVAGLTPGSHVLTVTVTVPPDLELIAVSPAQVTVVIQAPAGPPLARQAIGP